MSCTISQNQSIYQALLDRATSYPADKVYQAKAYQKAAESVRTCNENLYYCTNYSDFLNGVSYKIEEFIAGFIKTFPANKATAPPEPNQFLTGAAKAMEDARNAAAAAAPKDVTTWPNDDAERTAFQQKLNASKNASDAASDAVRKAVLEAPIGRPLTAQQIANIINEEWSKVDELDLKRKQEREEKWKQITQRMQESQKPVVYTAENPRRSRRLINKPKVEYFTKEDEQDEIDEAIQTLCKKKGWDYSDDMPTEFEAWFPTADKWSTEKYDYKTSKYVPRTKIEMAKYWTQYISNYIKKQQKEMKLAKGLIKYCEKNNIEYEEQIDSKFAAWMADPANKKLITATYTSYGDSCSCSSCNPNAAPREAKDYSYERSPSYCVKAWFSTLKKQIIW